MSTSQETQQSLQQEHLAEKEKLNKEKLEQEEKLKARIQQLTEEKEVRWPVAVPLSLGHWGLSVEALPDWYTGSK